MCLCVSVHGLQSRFPIDSILCSEDICVQVAKLSEIVPEFHVFGPPNFGGRGGPDFKPNFINLGSPANMWQSLVTIGQATSEIRRRGKVKMKTSTAKHGLPQNIMACTSDG